MISNFNWFHRHSTSTVSSEHSLNNRSVIALSMQTIKTTWCRGMSPFTKVGVLPVSCMVWSFASTWLPCINRQISSTNLCGPYTSTSLPSIQTKRLFLFIRYAILHLLFSLHLSSSLRIIRALYLQPNSPFRIRLYHLRLFIWPKILYSFSSHQPCSYTKSLLPSNFDILNSVSWFTFRTWCLDLRVSHLSIPFSPQPFSSFKYPSSSMSSLQASNLDRALADSSSQSLSGSYNSTKKRNHPFYAFGVFDIFAHVRNSTALYESLIHFI